MTLTMDIVPKIWENEYVKTAIMVLLIIGVVFGFWYGSQLVLNTQYPALAVASGSMCKPYRMNCDGWSHPFSQTLHIGDLIIVQGVAPEEIEGAPYPDGDIIVFHQPSAGGELIVHRAIDEVERDGIWYFQTKGDGNLSPDHGEVSEDQVVGKVILRIPWVGHIALFLHNSSGIFIIIILIVILVIVEFVIPMFSSEKAEVDSGEKSEKVAET
ncbi:MAG: signal peptidase I [Candidatus Bathyarchaeota archaeon]|nr:signal peptidase I [Candidatus Bathyarchaeota archaeon]